MDERAKPLADLLELNHRLVLNCLDDVSDAQARTRVVAGLNSVSFLLAHLIDVRHTLLRMLGGNQPNPVAAALEGATSIEDVGALPSVAELGRAWQDVHATLSVQVQSADAPTWNVEAPQRYPGVPATVLGAFTFLMQHESYHLGQMALLRRAHGLPAMRYRARPTTAP